MNDDLIKTKELIFDAFIEMTSELGYENVSMRDIATKVGIQVASIYNHFKTKNSILEYAYDYHSKRQYENRIPIGQMKKLIESADANEIIKLFLYSYKSEDQKKYLRMVLISKIIYMRLYQDPLAKANYIEGNNNNAEYIVEILRHGVDVGRMAPDFDIGIFAELIIDAIHAMAIKAYLSASQTAEQFENEERIVAILSRLLETAMDNS